MSYAKPIVEVVYEGNGSFHLEFIGRNFEHIMTNHKIQDLPLVVFSISGEFKGGKSVFLNLLLRFLENRGEKNWTGQPMEELETVFSVCGGNQIETRGIWMLDEPIIVKVNGNKLAVFLIDTQGCFNDKPLDEETFLLNAFSMLMSSCFIYNCRHLNHISLQFITQLANILNELKGDDASNTLEQSILYLVRDHNNPKNFGLDPGSNLLLNILENEPEFGSSFSLQQCCLLPRPGDKVVDQEINEDQEYNTIKMGDFREVFLENVGLMCKNFFVSKNISLKKVENKVLTCQEYREHIESCMPKFKKGELQYAKSAKERCSDLTSEMEKLRLELMTKTKELEVSEKERSQLEGEKRKLIQEKEEISANFREDLENLQSNYEEVVIERDRDLGHSMKLEKDLEDLQSKVVIERDCNLGHSMKLENDLENLQSNYKEVVVERDHAVKHIGKLEKDLEKLQSKVVIERNRVLGQYMKFEKDLEDLQSNYKKVVIEKDHAVMLETGNYAPQVGTRSYPGSYSSPAQSTRQSFFQPPIRQSDINMGLSGTPSSMGNPHDYWGQQGPQLSLNYGMQQPTQAPPPNIMAPNPSIYVPPNLLQPYNVQQPDIQTTITSFSYDTGGQFM